MLASRGWTMLYCPSPEIPPCVPASAYVAPEAAFASAAVFDTDDGFSAALFAKAAFSAGRVIPDRRIFCRRRCVCRADVFFLHIRIKLTVFVDVV